MKDVHEKFRSEKFRAKLKENLFDIQNTCFPLFGVIYTCRSQLAQKRKWEKTFRNGNRELYISTGISLPSTTSVHFVITTNTQPAPFNASHLTMSLADTLLQMYPWICVKRQHWQAVVTESVRFRNGRAKSISKCFKWFPFCARNVDNILLCEFWFDPRSSFRIPVKLVDH